jgi:phage-related minor tail protein
MTTKIDTFTVPVEADISPFKKAMDDMIGLSDKFGATVSRSLQNAVVNGRSFGDTLRSITMQLSTMALKQGLKPVENLASTLFSTILSSFANVPASANGNVVGSTGIVPFASGGVVSSPTYFQAGNQIGLMGEAGAEAILPLSRGSDGRLGVRTQGERGPTNVVFNITTPNVDSFRKSEAQLTAMLARAVGRGRRSL